ncbi:MAG: methionine adenosyltransferase domain-containing protein [Pseudolabrys sp.]
MSLSPLFDNRTVTLLQKRDRLSFPKIIHGRICDAAVPIATELASLVRKVFPLSPKEMIDHLCLRRPIFRKTATYGHFGRDDIIRRCRRRTKDKVGLELFVYICSPPR